MTQAAPEFSRPVAVDRIGGEARGQTIGADPAERQALARRFRLRSLDRLEADYVLIAEAGGWLARGTVRADALQACVASGQDVPEHIDAPFAIRFVTDIAASEDEVELSEEDCDIMAVEDGRIDMGEAVAQTLSLNLDPYPRSPDADAWLKQMGVKQEGEMGALAGLKDLLGKKG